MTKTTATQIATQVASRYEGLSFAPIDRKPNTSKNHTRGARKTRKRNFIR